MGFSVTPGGSFEANREQEDYGPKTHEYMSKMIFLNTTISDWLPPASNYAGAVQSTGVLLILRFYIYIICVSLSLCNYFHVTVETLWSRSGYQMTTWVSCSQLTDGPTHTSASFLGIGIGKTPWAIVIIQARTNGNLSKECVAEDKENK